jgi:transforming growth factor-beta-induced protein
MKNMKWIVLVVLALALMVAPTMAQDANIVDIVVAADDFSTLEAAVIEAGLAGTLAGGEFTVFAPTNGAFNTLLTDLGLTAEELLANKDLLTTVLTYHVIPGEVKAADVVAALPFEAASVQGEPISFALDESGRVGINGGQATVVITDVDVSNGVIHIIDNVILPPSVVAALGG